MMAINAFLQVDKTTKIVRGRPVNLRGHIFIIGLFFLIFSGCANEEYAAEKLFWKAAQKYNYILAHAQQSKPRDFQEAILAYREVIGKFPSWENTPAAYFNISYLYTLQKQYGLARKELETVIENFPQRIDVCAGAVFSLALSYEEEGSWNKALERLVSLEDNYPDTSAALQVPFYIAQHYKKAADTVKSAEAFEEAVLKYKSIIEEKQDTVKSLLALDLVIVCYLEQNKKDDALGYLSEVIEKYPNSALKAKALFSGGVIYYNLGKREEAVKSLERIIADFPNSALAGKAKEQIKKIREKNSEN